MRSIAFTTMNLLITTREWPRVLCFVIMMAMVPAFAADTPAAKNDSANRAAASDKDVIVSTKPMEIEVEDTGAHGQLIVASEVVSPDSRTDLIYTISGEPLHGRVGLAGAGEG